MKHLFVKTTTKSKEETDTRSRGELLQTSRDHPWWTGSGTGSDDFWWHVTYSLLLCFRKCSVVCEDPEVQSTVGGFFKCQTHRQRWMFLGVLCRLDPGAGSPVVPGPGASEQCGHCWWRLSHSFLGFKLRAFKLWNRFVCSRELMNFKIVRLRSLYKPLQMDGWENGFEWYFVILKMSNTPFYSSTC